MRFSTQNLQVGKESGKKSPSFHVDLLGLTTRLRVVLRVSYVPLRRRLLHQLTLKKVRI